MKKLLVILFSIYSFNLILAQGYKIGDLATDFNLKNVDGKMVSLAGIKNAKGYIVIFTCNHCPYSIAYENRIIALDKMFNDKGYPVIAINPNDNNEYPEDSFENMVVRAKEKAFTFPYLIDEGQKVYPKYGATRTPHVFVLKKEKTSANLFAISSSPAAGLLPPIALMRFFTAELFLSIFVIS